MAPHTSDAYAAAMDSVRARPRTWLVTGAAGFIGSNLVEALLRLGQRVVGVDSFITGHRRNLDDAVRAAGGSGSFEFIEGDIADLDIAARCCTAVDTVLHQAALGSVPRSLANPLETNRANVTGFLAMLVAAKDAGVERFVYAGSSSVYGDDPDLPKREDRVGRPLSPYAATKRADELYAQAFSATFQLAVVGLRYFNVFGPRQDPDGPYAAVIPKWIAQLLAGKQCEIFGDGETSRDFCYVANVVQANLLAAMAPAQTVRGEVYNVAVGQRTTLNELFTLVRDLLATHDPELAAAQPVHLPERPGDVRHSLADVRKIEAGLGYAPTHDLEQGMREALPWYRESLAASSP